MKLNLNKGQKLWFTSDTHYNHANICSATTQWKDPVTCREFKTLEHMNATLVGNINEFVGQDDVLFHLGDSVDSNKYKSSENKLYVRTFTL